MQATEAKLSEEMSVEWPEEMAMTFDVDRFVCLWEKIYVTNNISGMPVKIEMDKSGIPVLDTKPTKWYIIFVLKICNY